MEHLEFAGRCAGVAVLLLISASISSAAPQAPGTRLDTDPLPGVSSSCQPQIAVNASSTLHTVWQDFRSSNWQIFYRRGASFGSQLDPTDTALSSVGNAAAPQVAVNTGADAVHVAWRAVLPTGEERIYVASSPDDGQTWPSPGSETQVSPASDYVSDPRIAADDQGGVYVLWATNGGGGDALYLARSLDGGQTWLVPLQLTLVSHMSEIFDFALETDGGPNLYVAFAYSPNGLITSHDVWFYGSNDQGNTFPHVQRLFIGPAPYEVRLAASPTGHVHVVWNDGNKRLESQRNTSFGAAGSWLPAPVLAAPPADINGRQFGLDLATDMGGNAHLAWTRASTTYAGATPLTISNAAVAVFPTASNQWDAFTEVSNADLFPLGHYARARARVAVSGGMAAVAWMQIPQPNGRYADVRMSYTRDLGQTWTSPLVLNGELSQTTRAGFPQLALEPDRAAVVWDERRFWTPPGTPGTAHGAPETFLRIISTP